MLHSTKLINKIIITLMALLLLFNTNYGAFKTSEAHANVLTATFEEWAAATYAGVAVGTMALATGAMHTEQYLLDNVDKMYQTAKESWKTMAPDMKANFLSSVEKMEDGIVTVGDWITGALDMMKANPALNQGGSTTAFLTRLGSNNFLLPEGYVATVTYTDFYTGKKETINHGQIPYLKIMGSNYKYQAYVSSQSKTPEVKFDYDIYDRVAAFHLAKSPSWSELVSLASLFGATYTLSRDGAVVEPPGTSTYSRLDDWIRERAIPNGQLGVYNPGAQAYTPDGYRLGLSSDGQTLLKLPDGIPWEGTADWKQPLLNTVDGTTAVLDTEVGSWIDVATGQKIRDATVTEMVSGTGVDESTAEYVLIKAKDEEKAREETGEYAGKPYEGDRNPDLDFRNRKGKSTLDKHADKHGYVSSEKYLQNARNFLEKTPTSTTQTFVSKEGTYFRYDTATNEFGIINKYGGISTYFKPEDKIVYWLKQIELYAPK